MNASLLVYDLLTCLVTYALAAGVLAGCTTLIMVWFGFFIAYRGDKKCTPFWIGATPALLTSIACLAWLAARNYVAGHIPEEQILPHFFGHPFTLALIASGAIIGGLVTDKHHLTPKPYAYHSGFWTAFLLVFLVLP